MLLLTFGEWPLGLMAFFPANRDVDEAADEALAELPVVVAVIWLDGIGLVFVLLARVGLLLIGFELVCTTDDVGDEEITEDAFCEMAEKAAAAMFALAWALDAIVFALR